MPGHDGLLTIDGPRSNGRLIVFGDIHGCIEELQTLLERIAPATNDIIVSAGDIVRKGPRPDRCLDLWQKRGYLAVLGNNERKLLKFARARWLARLLMPQADRQMMKRRDLLDYITSWPVAIDFPSARVAVVHGGFLPGMSVTPRSVDEHREDLVSLRYVRKTEKGWERVPKGHETDSDRLWAEVWSGERTVIYGHTPVDEPRLDEKAIGLDTGCVYGGELTAAVFENGVWRFERTPARRAYAKR